MFDIKPGVNIFHGKAPVIIFAEKVTCITYYADVLNPHFPDGFPRFGMRFALHP
jgi:hypothetical protein